MMRKLRNQKPTCFYFRVTMCFADRMNVFQALCTRLGRRAL